LILDVEPACGLCSANVDSSKCPPQLEAPGFDKLSLQTIPDIEPVEMSTPS